MIFENAYALAYFFSLSCVFFKLKFFNFHWLVFSHYTLQMHINYWEWEGLCKWHVSLMAVVGCQLQLFYHLKSHASPKFGALSRGYILDAIILGRYCLVFSDGILGLLVVPQWMLKHSLHLWCVIGRFSSYYFLFNFSCFIYSFWCAYVRGMWGSTLIAFFSHVLSLIAFL